MSQSLIKRTVDSVLTSEYSQTRLTNVALPHFNSNLAVYSNYTMTFDI